MLYWHFFFFQAEDGIRDYKVTGVQTCALPISFHRRRPAGGGPVAGQEQALDGRPLGRAERVDPRADREGRAVLGDDPPPQDRKSVVSGKRVDLGGRRIIKKKKARANRYFGCLS